MSEQDFGLIMAKTVAVTVASLSDDELIALNMVALLDSDPHDRLFDYESVKSLFTERNGTKMHEATKQALNSVVAGRLV